MKPSSLKHSKKPMKRSSFDQAAHKADIKAGKKRLCSKQRSATAEEKALWDRMANEVGCIACQLDGRFNTYVSIHHVKGRTTTDAHKWVIPLCAGHHQDGTGNDKSMIAVHPHKARFEARYGKQTDLVRELWAKLGVDYAA